MDKINLIDKVIKSINDFREREEWPEEYIIGRNGKICRDWKYEELQLQFMGEDTLKVLGTLKKYIYKMIKDELLTGFYHHALNNIKKMENEDFISCIKRYRDSDLFADIRYDINKLEIKFEEITEIDKLDELVDKHTVKKLKDLVYYFFVNISNDLDEDDYDEAIKKLKNLY